MVLSEKLNPDWKKAATIQNLAIFNNIKLPADLKILSNSKFVGLTFK